MPYDGVFPVGDDALGQMALELVAENKEQLARTIYDEYVALNGKPTNTATLCRLGVLWRELGDETRLLETFYAVERTPKVDRNHRANVHRDLSLFYAKHKKHRKAAEIWDVIIELKLRTDRVERVSDGIANAKRLMYAKDIAAAITAIRDADRFAHESPVIVPPTIENLNWWTFMIAVQAGDYVLAAEAMSWLLNGREIRGCFIPPTNKPVRVKMLRMCEKASASRLAPHLRQRAIVYAALLYDRLPKR